MVSSEHSVSNGLSQHNVAPLTNLGLLLNPLANLLCLGLEPLEVRRVVWMLNDSVQLARENVRAAVVTATSGNVRFPSIPDTSGLGLLSTQSGHFSQSSEVAHSTY